MKMKIVIITIAVLVTLMVGAIVALVCMFHNQYAAAQSVELVGDKMLVAESPLCTNHYLAESRLKDYSLYSEDSHRRYDSMKQMRDSLSTMNPSDVTESIRRVAAKDMTRWSVVFDSKTLTATYYQYSDFDKPYMTRVLK